MSDTDPGGDSQGVIGDKIPVGPEILEIGNLILGRQQNQSEKNKEN